MYACRTAWQIAGRLIAPWRYALDPRPDLAPAVGGILGMEYGPTGVAITHPIHLAVAAFNPTPVGPSGDFLYNGTPLPGESGVLATFAAIGNRWAPYYPPTWSLRLVSVWQNVDGFPTVLTTVPAASAVAGTGVGAPHGDPTVQRVLSVYSETAARWRIFLRRLAPTPVGVRVQVTPTGGGIDAKDRAWLDYLHGPASAVLARDGTRFQVGGHVRVWWDTPLPADITLVVGYVVSG